MPHSRKREQFVRHAAAAALRFSEYKDVFWRGKFILHTESNVRTGCVFFMNDAAGISDYNTMAGNIFVDKRVRRNQYIVPDGYPPQIAEFNPTYTEFPNFGAPKCLPSLTPIVEPFSMVTLSPSSAREDTVIL